MIPKFILGLFGWTLDEVYPDTPKYVAIAAPHTSSYDAPLALLAMWALSSRFCWIAKHSLFWWPLGPILKAVGGVPIDRRVRSNFVDQMVDMIKERDQVAIAIMPEGTRRLTEYWKSGFYHLAVGADVPISLGYIDYSRRRLGLGAFFKPSGDLEQDLEIIRDFYADKQGRNPEKQGEIRIRSRNDT